jgi:glycerol-3-phosphate dehydrogenase
VRLGLFLYDWMGARSTLGASEGVRFASSPYGKPLRPAMRYGFAYSDCTCDDSRLVILNAKDAAERRAEIRVGHRLVRATRDAKDWRAEIHDEVNGKTYVVAARIIVNAAGPWVAEVLKDRLGAERVRTPRLVKGSHIVLRKLYDGQHAYALQHSDRRLVFVMPYLEDFTLVGTTDVPWSGEPGPVEIHADEMHYLCDVVNRAFDREVRPKDVVWSFAGIRALQDDGAARASAVTRDYVLDLDAPIGQAPVLTILGGKLTTYRVLAEQALETLEPFFGNLAPPWTETAPLPGGNIGGGDFAALPDALGRLYPFIPLAQCRRLAHAYGTRAMAVLDGVTSRADLGEQFGGGMSQREVDYLVREEWARTAHDIHWLHSKTGLWATPAEKQRLAQYLDPRLRSGAAASATRTGS